METSPPGRTKIKQAIKNLLRDRSFNDITWSEIAQAAGVSQGLIYKYFTNRRNLLHEMSQDYAEQFMAELTTALRGIEGSLNKLRKLIWMHLHYYERQRVFARVLQFEVMSSPDYFESRAYESIRSYGKTVLEILMEGVQRGEIRQDINLKEIRQLILGSVNYISLPGILYGTEINTDALTDDVCKVIFPGIMKTQESIARNDG